MATLIHQICAQLLALFALWFLAAEGSPGNDRPTLCAAVVATCAISIYYLIWS